MTVKGLAVAPGKTVVATMEQFIEAWDAALRRIWESVDWEWFENLWESCASEREFFELARTVAPEASFAQFDEGWQHRLVLHEDPEQAKLEFADLLFGWY